jgi:hypothetical protein
MRDNVGGLAVVLIEVMALGSALHVEDVWGGGSGSGAGAGGGGTGGGGTGGGGTGDDSSGGGAGDLSGVTRAGQAPADQRLYARSSARLTDAGGTGMRGLRGLLTVTGSKSRTWDAFRRCAPSGAILDRLRLDGSFTSAPSQ